MIAADLADGHPTGLMTATIWDSLNRLLRIESAPPLGRILPLQVVQFPGSRSRNGRTAGEVWRDISSLPVESNAKAFAHEIRSYWGMEHGCHWTVDETFRGYESRISEKRSGENMAGLICFGLSLLNKSSTGRASPGGDAAAPEATITSRKSLPHQQVSCCRPCAEGPPLS
ncbi:hypothetical protein [Planctomyces sp. SH-PL62]|uniref:hypothetical protein n=1 Tax=Planctomyces sp. SH-PL62 TaxID=1636152 RepID=UPI0012E7B8F6|nr:hypothetical protein [Planctomyces sp. SH-PL62]